MEKDNWGLKSLFHFDDKVWKINNDTANIVTVKSRDGQDIPVPPGETVNVNPDNYSVVLPNNQVFGYKDRSIKHPKYSENFNTIVGHLIRRLKVGQIIDGLDFLDYHYNWTKKKSRFLTFIKHYILTFSWVPVEQKQNNQMFIDAMSDWVEEKRKSRRKPTYIVLLTFPILIYIIGLIWLYDYRDIFIGALIGGIAAPLKEVYDLISD
jgi:hypothetical protein